MSPTVFRAKGYRFYFLSNEENRIHVHIECEKGEAKFWIEPDISLANSQGMSARLTNEIRALVEEHKHEIISKWEQHFGRKR